MTYKPSYRIKSKLRFTVAVVLSILLFVTLANTILGFDEASSMTKEKAPLEVYVSQGDSLWNIAAEYGPAGADIRETVNDICILNGITASTLYAGQTILVPDYSE